MKVIDADEFKERLIFFQAQCEANPSYATGVMYGVLQWGIETIDEQPTIEPVKHGKWINGDCSECGYPIPTDDRIDCIQKDEVHYCYNCGAKMEGEISV